MYKIVQQVVFAVLWAEWFVDCSALFFLLLCSITQVILLVKVIGELFLFCRGSTNQFLS